MVNSTLVSLPDDILLQVLLLSKTLQDLRSQILSSRRLLDAYNSRSALVVKTVILHQTEKLSQVEDPGQRALHFIALIVRRLHHDVLNNSIIAYEALEPIIATATYSNALSKWTVKLSRLYARVGSPTASARRLHLLERAYDQVVRQSKLNFHTEYEDPGSVNLELSRHWQRLSQPNQDLCRELAEEYASRSRLDDCLLIQTSVMQRLTLKDTDSEIWGGEITKTLEAIGDRKRAVRYHREMYSLCRNNRGRTASLSWSRRLVVAKVSAAVEVNEALDEQVAILHTLPVGTDEYIAWARQLVTMQKRAGRIEEALETKHAVWRQLGVQNSCFWGWARELADDYRKARQGANALLVIQEMHEQASRALARQPKDDRLAFHARLSEQALVAERAHRDQAQGSYVLTAS